MSSRNIEKTRAEADSGVLPDYRRFVGPEAHYDLAGATQFTLLAILGLREYHRVLDIGCGSLRVGKLLIPFLSPRNYFGIEPESWLIDQAVEREIGNDLLTVKRPNFACTRDFTLSQFGQQFDFILANSIFTHATREQIGKCLQESEKTLCPTGVFVATYIEGDPPYEGEEWVYPECVQYTFRLMADLAGDHGLDCRRIDWPHPGKQDWLAFGSRERLDRLPNLVTGESRDISKAVKDVLTPRTSIAGDVDIEALSKRLGTAIPPDRHVILVGDGQLPDGLKGDFRKTTFMEIDGTYVGPPGDDEAALCELTRLRRSGADFIAFVRSSLWWLDHYTDLRRHLYEEFQCVVDDDHLVLFDLRERRQTWGNERQATRRREKQT